MWDRKLALFWVIHNIIIAYDAEYDIIVLYRFKNKNNKCDACGADLIQRTDDNEKVIKDRLNTYKKETLPVINQLDKICKKHIKISGFLTITKINQELKKEV